MRCLTVKRLRRPLPSQYDMDGGCWDVLGTTLATEDSRRQPRINLEETAKMVIRHRRDVTAIGWMGFAVFAWSWYAVIVARVGTDINPLIFHVCYVSVVTALFSLYLAITFPAVLLSGKAWRFLLDQIPTANGTRSILISLHIVFFVWATYFFATAIVVVIYNGWLILFIFRREWSDRRRLQRYEPLPTSDRLLLVLAALGLGLVSLSQSDGLPLSSIRSMVFGLLLAASSAVCISWLSRRFDVGEDLYNHMESPQGENDDPKNELPYQVFVAVVYDALSVIISLIIALCILPFSDLIGIRALGGITSTSLLLVVVAAILDVLASIIFRYANLLTTNLGVNILMYITPVLSLVWLAIFTTLNVHRTDWLIVGATVVIVVNVLVNFRFEDRAGYKWLILCLLSFGFVVYMRDEWFGIVPGYGWFPSFSDYYSMVGASATLFILILSFRTSRVNARARDEGEKVFRLSRELSAVLPDNYDLLDHVRALDTTTNATRLARAYHAICSSIQKCEDSGLARSEVTRLQTDLDTLVHSKQRGRNMSELIVLVMLATATTSMILFARTEAEAWPNMLNDMFAILLASVIVFMTIHLFDQRRERNYPILAADGHGVLIWEADMTSDRTVERRVSVCIGFAVIAVYAYLMLAKWLPI